MDDQPIGAAVETAPAKPPGPVTLQGRFVVLEKLDPARHGDSLWRAIAGHERLWTYMGDGPFADRAAYSAWLDQRAARADPYAYAILDADGRTVGTLTLMEIRPAMRVIEVGNIVYSPALQRTPAGTEAQFLVARYAFEDLGYRRYEWKCNALNAPSRRAAERFGFTYEGTFRQHMIVKGRNRDTAWFSITDAEWPARRAAFEAWLAPENFDAGGRQRKSLADFRHMKATA